MTTCHYCGQPAPFGERLTRDHIVPVARLGLDVEWNIVKSCQECNRVKGSSMPKCPCERCQRALRRWRMGERALMTRAQRKAAKRPSVPVGDAIPPELACLSPAMRALLLRRKES